MEKEQFQTCLLPFLSKKTVLQGSFVSKIHCYDVQKGKSGTTTDFFAFPQVSKMWLNGVCLSVILLKCFWHLLSKAIHF